MIQVVTPNERLSPEQFCFWFQGFSELNTTLPTAEQWQSIKEHLNLVFQKVMMPLVTTLPMQTIEPIEWPKLPDGQPVFIC